MGSNRLPPSGWANAWLQSGSVVTLFGIRATVGLATPHREEDPLAFCMYRPSRRLPSRRLEWLPDPHHQQN